jgi:hypothetical protein
VKAVKKIMDDDKKEKKVKQEKQKVKDMAK